MPITDPQAIRFCNDVRGLAEVTRAYKAALASFRARYDGGTGSFFYGHGNETIVDNRASEGVTTLIGDDMLNFNAKVLYATYDAMNVAGFDAVLEKFAVNPLRGV